MAYTNIDDPSAYFQVKKWTGNASTNAITLDGNTDMQPDFMWHKEQNDTNGWHQFDSSRGVTKYLASQNTAAEGTFGGYLSSFDSNGFTAGSGDSSMNSSGTAQCSWMWHCNAGTTASNTDGSITSTVQANTDAGFSIVTYTGNGSTADQTVGHGLGVRANAVIVKNRDSAVNWVVYVDGLTVNHCLELNTTDPQSDSTQGRVLSSSAGSYGTSSIFTLRNGSGSVIQTNTSGEDYIAYCFAEKQGFSRFSSYVGNGARDGVFVYTGFQPAFVMIKCFSAANGRWTMFDNKRTIANGDMDYLVADADHAESNAGLGYTDPIDLVSNGFKIRNSDLFTNQSGTSYIYMAFAENPFVTSTGIPTTAR